MIDEAYGIIGSSQGSQYYVRKGGLSNELEHALKEAKMKLKMLLKENQIRVKKR